MQLEESFTENRPAAFYMGHAVLTIPPGALLWIFLFQQNASHNILLIVFVFMSVIKKPTLCVVLLSSCDKSKVCW